MVFEFFRLCNDAINIFVKVFVQAYVFIFLGMYLGVELWAPLLRLKFSGEARAVLSGCHIQLVMALGTLYRVHETLDSIPSTAEKQVHKIAIKGEKLGMATLGELE